MNPKRTFTEALTAWHHALWQVQLQQYPDSVLRAPTDAFRWWVCGPDGEVPGYGKENRLAVFALAATYPGGVFYECGEGGKWHGYRYGLEPGEYLSGLS